MFAEEYRLNLKPFSYSHSDPKTYKGPIVKGWPPSKSRDMKAYIAPDKDTVLTDLSCLDLSNVKVLILIQSAPNNYERRKADRETWMQFQVQFTPVNSYNRFIEPLLVVSGAVNPG